MSRVPLRPGNIWNLPAGRVQRVDAGPDGDVATLRVDGLLCGACASRVQSHLAAVPGVTGASCDLQTGEARVTYAKDAVEPAALERAVRRAALFMPLRRLLAWTGRGRWHA